MVCYRLLPCSYLSWDLGETVITIQKLREAIQLPATSEIEVELLRDQVISLWEETTKRLWNARTGHIQILTMRTTRMSTVYPELLPVSSYTSVEHRKAGDDWVELETDDYIDLGAKLRKISGYWYEYVRLTYSGGTDEADEMIQRALITQAQFMVSRFAKDKIATQSQNFEGGAGVFLRADLHPLFKTLAKQYSRK